MRRPLLLGMIVGLLATSALAQTGRTPAPALRARVPSTLAILNQRIPEVRFIDQPFEQVMEWIADYAQLNVVVRWQTLDDSGISRDAPVSIQARNLRLSQVLWLIMNEAGGADLKLAYRASGTLLILSTEEDLSKEMITKVYDVADLLIRLPNTPMPDLSQNQGLQQGGQGGSGGGIFGQQGGQGGQGGQYGQDQQNATEANMEILVEIIQQTVEPDSWRDTGGGLGSIQAFRNLLIVHNSILVHQKLGGYIREELAGP